MASRQLRLLGESDTESCILRAGSEAVRLLAGTIPMLIVAGILEGFVSPTGVSVVIKFGISASDAGPIRQQLMRHRASRRSRPSP